MEPPGSRHLSRSCPAVFPLYSTAARTQLTEQENTERAISLPTASGKKTNITIAFHAQARICVSSHGANLGNIMQHVCARRVVCVCVYPAFACAESSISP
ncbi:unnamed protein product [Polarella glacialis]|uniref:Uncharacterized protein n=1 Tax=Polarella glacialis TaxID=89957 RepID=A0A813EDM4_POLGL|nr:unnamed protein product [Polarella glacialis]